MSERSRSKTQTGRARRRDEFEYRWLMAVAFLVFLPPAMLTRLLSPRHWRLRASGKARSGSPVRAAWEAAEIAVGSCFMA